MLYILPVSLFGMSVAAAALPEMSRDAGTRMDVLRARMEAGLRRIALLVIPSAVGYILLGDVIVSAIYERGEFLAADTLVVWLVLAAYSTGLLASTSTRLYASTFYALNDTRTPARIAFIRVAIAAALGAALMLAGEQYAIGPDWMIGPNTGDPGARPLGVVGLAVAAGMAAWIEWVMLRRRIRERAGGLGMGRAIIARLAVAAVVAAALVRLGMPALPALDPVIRAAITLPLFGVGYLVMARLLGVADAMAMVRGILGGRGRDSGGA
jgi:putative peptidoglycan lipid II flippase